MIRTKSQKVHFTLASTVSVMVHALLVLLLYEAYSELREARRPSLVIVARDSTARTVTLPDLAVQLDETPVALKVAAESRRRPDELVASMPRLPLARDELPAIQPLLESPTHVAVPSQPRATTSASLPIAPVATPIAPQGFVASLSDLPVIQPANVPLARSDTSATEPWQPASTATPRIASLPTTGPRHRPLRLPLDLPTSERTPAPARTRQPAPAFAHRFRKPEPTDERDLAIARGLEFLARVQLDDGRWRFDYLRGAVDVDAEPVNIRADAAATGLALLAFLGAGHDHFEGPYALVVGDGLQYLVRVQQPTGELFPEDGQPTGQVARFYSHGIGTLALCEAYGMTGDAALCEPAQRAVDHLIATQHPELGGWRYVPGQNTDLSVTGWQTAALRSGELAGLTVRREAMSQIRACLEMCRDTDGNPSLFRYNPWASPSDPLTRHGRQPSTVMTAVGLAMHFQLGSDADDSRAQLSGEHLAAHLPDVGDTPAVATTGTLENPLRDTYYWYYGTQAMYYLGGEPWRAWSERLDPLLVESQETAGRLAGSWDPFRPVPDKWAAYGGRLYVTAMNLLSLEIRNRHLRFDAETPPQIAERPEESQR